MASVESFGQLMITASKNYGQESIGLSVPSTISVGTYNLGSILSSYRATYIWGNQAEDLYNSGDGNGSQLTITSHDLNNKVISGTFHFVATPDISNPSTDTFDITGGTFTINY